LCSDKLGEVARDRVAPAVNAILTTALNAEMVAELTGARH
jgi:hypothetical protein